MLGLSCGTMDLHCDLWDPSTGHTDSLLVACRLRSGSRWVEVLCGKRDLSSPTRDQTHVPCISRWILNHWTTREVRLFIFNGIVIALQCDVTFCCYNNLNQLYVPIHPLPLKPPSHPHPTLSVITEGQAELPLWSCGLPLTTVLYVVVCINVGTAVSAHPSFSFPPCPQVRSLRLRFYSCPADRFIRAIFF